MRKSFFHIIFLVSLLLLIQNLKGAGFPGSSDSIIIHRVKIDHPGKIGEPKAVNDLVEVRNSENFPIAFYMDVPSVYCSDSVCKVVSVRLFWNILGEYQQFKIDSKVNFEKGRDNYFSDDDYRKLNRILHDQQSPFKEISINDIEKVNNSDGVDGVTGATTIALDEKSTIQGASLTCYSLWHWANGEIVPIIRQFTAQSCSIQKLIAFVESENCNDKFFGMQQLLPRKEYHPETVSAVLGQVDQCDGQFIKLAINFLEAAPPEIYFSTLEQLLKGEKQQNRLLLLNSLFKTNKNLPQAYIERLSKRMSVFTSYQEIDLFLKLVEKNHAASEVVVDQIFLLLKKDVITARRAFWFLSGCDLTPNQKNTLKLFRANNHDL